MCSPRKTGNTTPHRGGGLPGWDGQENGRGRPVGRGQTYTTGPGFMAKPADQVSGGERQGLGNQPTSVGRRRAQFSVVRGTRGSHRTLPQQKMRVTTATPEATRERSNERALAEARCPNSVPSGKRPCAPISDSPAKSLVEQAGCGWQWVERPWATSSDEFDARPIGWCPTMPASGRTCGRGSDYPSLSRSSMAMGTHAEAVRRSHALAAAARADRAGGTLRRTIALPKSFASSKAASARSNTCPSDSAA